MNMLLARGGDHPDLSYRDSLSEDGCARGESLLPDSCQSRLLLARWIRSTSGKLQGW